MARSRRPATGGSLAPESALKERILDAAFGAFMEKGYASTSTLEIATRAKVSKRELYALFRNKQDMFAAGIAACARRMAQPLDLPPARDGAALAATLVAFGTIMLREVTQPEVAFVYRLAAAEADRSPEVAETLYASGREPPLRALVQFLTGAQSSGLLVGGDPERMAAQYFSLLTGDLLMRQMLRLGDPPGEAEISRRARAATDALLTLHPAPRRDEG